MFILSGTIALSNNHILTGAAIKDGGTANIVTANRNVRYVGDTIYAANAGLPDMDTAQDLVTRMYNGSAAFRNFVAALIAGGLSGTAIGPTGATDILDVTFQFAAHLTSGEYLYVLGSSHDESPTMRYSCLTSAIALLEADADFGNTTGILAGVVAP